MMMSHDDGSVSTSLACTDILFSLTKYIASLKSMVRAKYTKRYLHYLNDFSYVVNISAGMSGEGIIPQYPMH